MSIEAGKKMIFITSWPFGKAILVEILGGSPHKEDGFYIRKPNGGSDTTTSDFLFDLPEGLTNKE